MALGGVTRPRTRPLDLRRIYKERDALIGVYRSAERRLARLAAEDIANDRLASAAYRQRRIAIIRAELAALQDQAIPLSTTLVTNAYTTAAVQTMESVPAALAASPAALEFGTGLHAEALGTLADNMASALNAAAEQIGRRVEDVYRREGLRASTRLFVEGSTRKDASSYLSRSLLRQGATSIRSGGTDRVVQLTVGGREWNLEKYTSMVIRTTTSEAATTGVVNSIVEAGLDLVEIAVADPCPICAPYEGNVYSLSGQDKEYPPLEDEPPYHPNCECTLVVSEVEINRELAA